MRVAPVSLVGVMADVRSGRLSARAAAEAACDRIDAVDADVLALLSEPHRRARLAVAAETLARRDPGRRLPLHGVLVGVKDIFHVDGFATLAGTEVPPACFAGPEAVVVTALRAAGALVLGKTVTTEFAFYEPGPTRNPHDLARTPGGSSSGSAAAVAAGMCPVALGTQTIGSVVRPAAYCGVVGFKPTFGRVDGAGVVPFSGSADTLGWFTADAASLLPVAEVLVADWRADLVIADGRPDLGIADWRADLGIADWRADLGIADWRAGLGIADWRADLLLGADGPGAGRRPVLGVPDGPYLDQASPAGRAAFRAALDRLSGAGFAVRETPVMADIAAINRRHRQMVAAELAEVHRAWFAEFGDRYRPRTAAFIRDGQAVTAEDLASARSGRTTLRDALGAAMAEAGIDLWLSPSAPGPAPLGITSTGDPAMNLPWTHAGLPVVSLPAGRVDGMPVGLQCAGAWGDDERLVGWAIALEAALR